ncbi:hypothetical protein K7432_000343 [Basidiobolus ranarum]|uniref:Cytochrome P450 n=1 Tax=Basidiobolus ranarum TaxID=34480 RepID=A0ABR2WBG2_9FUNG
MDNGSKWSDLSQSLVALVTTFGVILFLWRGFCLLRRILTDPLRTIPSPKWYELIKLEVRLWFSKWILHSKMHYDQLHVKFGPVVRIGLSKISVADPELIMQILKNSNLEVGRRGYSPYASLAEPSHVVDERDSLLIEPRVIAVIDRLFNTSDDHTVKDTLIRPGMVFEKRKIISKLVSDIIATVVLGLDSKKLTKYRHECVVNLIYESRKWKNMAHRYPILTWIPFSPLRTTSRTCDEELKRKILALIEDAESDDHQIQLGSIINFRLERTKDLLHKQSEERITEEILTLILNIEETLFTCLSSAFENILNDTSTLEQIEARISQIIDSEYQKMDVEDRGKMRVTFEEKYKHHLLTFKHLKPMKQFQQVIQKSMDCSTFNDLLRYTGHEPFQLGKCLLPRNTELRIPFKVINHPFILPGEERDPVEENLPEPIYLSSTEFAHYTSQRLVFMLVQSTLANLLTRYRLETHSDYTAWNHLVPPMAQGLYQKRYIRFSKRTRVCYPLSKPLSYPNSL